MEPLISKTPARMPDQPPATRRNNHQGTQSFSEVIEHRKIEQSGSSIKPHPGTASVALSRDELHRTGTSLEQTLERLRIGRIRLDDLLERLQDGHPVGEPEMVLIQGMMLSTSRDIEMISKMVEQLVSGIKTTMQTQV